MKIKKMSCIVGVLLVLVVIISCGQTLPPEKFAFDSKFDSLYKALSYKDTIFFENSKHGIDTFILTKVDSAIFNRTNCFMCPVAEKSIFRNYKQYQVNYWAEHRVENQGTSKQKEITREVPLITITVRAEKNLNTAYISFKNFRCSIEGSLGKPLTDTLIIGDRLFTNYYIFQSTASSLVRDKDDVQSIFVSLIDGIVGYKEKSGVVRKRVI